MEATSGLFKSIPENDFLEIFDDELSRKPDARKIARLLDFNASEVGRAAEVTGQVRLEPDRISDELEQRIWEWGIALNLVANFFKDEKKTVMWFRTPNPLLGDIAPRDMIRVGRFKKLLRFIQTALNESQTA